MVTVTLKGNAIKLAGSLPALGAPAPDFKLTKADLTEITLHDLVGHKVILNIFPSIDTPVCATSVRKFNEKASQLPNVKILCISADLPFAAKRFCAAENLNNVITASTFRHPEFGKNYGVTIMEGPLAGLMSRALVILDEEGNVAYTQQVGEIANEPDYDAALKELSPRQ